MRLQLVLLFSSLVVSVCIASSAVQQPKKPVGLPPTKVQFSKSAFDFVQKFGDQYCEEMSNSATSLVNIDNYKSEYNLQTRLCDEKHKYKGYGSADQLSVKNEIFYANYLAVWDAIKGMYLLLRQNSSDLSRTFERTMSDWRQERIVSVSQYNDFEDQIENPQDSSKAVEYRKNFDQFSDWVVYGLNKTYRDNSN